MGVEGNQGGGNGGRDVVTAGGLLSLSVCAHSRLGCQLTRKILAWYTPMPLTRSLKAYFKQRESRERERERLQALRVPFFPLLMSAHRAAVQKDRGRLKSWPFSPKEKEAVAILDELSRVCVFSVHAHCVLGHAFQDARHLVCCFSALRLGASRYAWGGGKS